MVLKSGLFATLGLAALALAAPRTGEARSGATVADSMKAPQDLACPRH